MSEHAEFNSRVWRDAWQQTVRFARRHTVSGGCVLALWVAGSVIYGSIRGWAAVMEELWIFISFTVIPVAGFIIALFLWNLALAPFRILEERLGATTDGTLSGDEYVQHGSSPVAPDYDKWGSLDSARIDEISYLCAGEDPYAGGHSQRHIVFLRHIMEGVEKNEIKRTDGRKRQTRAASYGHDAQYEIIYPNLNDYSSVSLSDVQDYFQKMGIKSDFFDGER